MTGKRKPKSTVRRGKKPELAEKPKTKRDTLLALLQRKEGAALGELMEASGWQAHSVRGFLSRTVKKDLALSLISELRDGERRYWIEPSSVKGPAA